MAGQVVRQAALESRDTADLEVCATLAAAPPRPQPAVLFFFADCGKLIADGR